LNILHFQTIKIEGQLSSEFFPENQCGSLKTTSVKLLLNVKQEIVDAFKTYIPYIQLDNLDIKTASDNASLEKNQVRIVLRYSIIGTPFGDTISWMRSNDRIYVKILNSNGTVTAEFNVPVGDFAF
jgi:hypothetical protein